MRQRTRVIQRLLNFLCLKCPAAVRVCDRGWRGAGVPVRGPAWKPQAGPRLPGLGSGPAADVDSPKYEKLFWMFSRNSWSRWNSWRLNRRRPRVSKALQTSRRTFASGPHWQQQLVRAAPAQAQLTHRIIWSTSDTPKLRLPRASARCSSRTSSSPLRSTSMLANHCGRVRTATKRRNASVGRQRCGLHAPGPSQGVPPGGAFVPSPQARPELLDPAPTTPALLRWPRQ
jgi:hypothetical protein